MSDPIIARDPLTLACLLGQSPGKMALWISTPMWDADAQRFNASQKFWVCETCFNDNTWVGPRERETFFAFGVALAPMSTVRGACVGCNRSASVLT